VVRTATLLVSARPERGAGVVASSLQHELRCRSLPRTSRFPEANPGQEPAPSLWHTAATAAAAADALDRVAGMIKKVVYRSSGRRDPGRLSDCGRWRFVPECGSWIGTSTLATSSPPTLRRSFFSRSPSPPHSSCTQACTMPCDCLHSGLTLTGAAVLCASAALCFARQVYVA